MNRMIAFLLFLLLSINSCQIGANKDFLTGLSYSYDGLSVERVFLVKNDSILQTDKFPNQSTVYMYFEGVEGFQPKDGKVFPGLSLEVTDTDNKTILDFPDLFEQYNKVGITPEVASVLSANITVGQPMQVGLNYHWKITVWDKNGDGFLQSNIAFLVEENY